MRFVTKTRKIFWHFHLLENGKGREVTWNSFPSTFGQEHFSNLFNKSLFFSEWNIYKYFPLSLGSAMFFFHSISPLCKSWLVFMADQVQAWLRIFFGFLFRIHFVFLLFLIPSNFWMCDECIQFQSFPAEEWTPPNSKVNILSKTFHPKKKIVEKYSKEDTKAVSKLKEKWWFF